MRQNRWFAVVYMFLVTAFFSSIVIGFSQFTSERVEANRTAAFERAVLTVLPGMFEGAVGGLELHRRFVEQVTGPDKHSGGAYTLKKGGQLVSYALPISGQGFWAPIKGVIGIADDKRTIFGIAFYEQNETPGLGGQIMTSVFRNQFLGKVLSEGDKPLTFKRPGEVLGENDVHAVTGATQTSTRLEKIVNTALKDWSSKLADGSRRE
jgi:Na+-transporting NADH:ubiquinone oxidoreductase subunit C